MRILFFLVLACFFCFNSMSAFNETDKTSISKNEFQNKEESNTSEIRINLPLIKESNKIETTETNYHEIENYDGYVIEKKENMVELIRYISNEQALNYAKKKERIPHDAIRCIFIYDNKFDFDVGDYVSISGIKGFNPYLEGCQGIAKTIVKKVP